MPAVVLLNPDDPIYEFEHMMQHRNYFAVMSPLNRFSVLPYVLDPVGAPPGPAGPWNLNHQQAHNDFNRNLPSNYNDGYYLRLVTPVPPPTPPPPPYYEQVPIADAGTFGVFRAENLIEGSGTPENREWWTFTNHQEHFLADGAILPLPSTGDNTVLTNPWWWQTTPIVFPFW